MANIPGGGSGTGANVTLAETGSIPVCATNLNLSQQKQWFQLIFVFSKTPK
jgi:hypothetical protein